MTNPAFFQASLGLAGFCLLAWISLPWAFSERIENLTKDKPREKSEPPRHWLRIAEDLFLASGIFLAFDVIIESGVNSSLPDYLSTPIFTIGVLTFVSAILQTFLIIDFVSFPESERGGMGDAVSHIGGLMIVSSLWGLNAILGYSLYKMIPLTLIGLGLLVAFALGSTVIPYRVMREWRSAELTIRDRTMVLLVAPILFYLIVYGSGLPVA